MNCHTRFGAFHTGTSLLGSASCPTHTFSHLELRRHLSAPWPRGNAGTHLQAFPGPSGGPDLRAQTQPGDLNVQILLFIHLFSSYYCEFPQCQALGPPWQSNQLSPLAPGGTGVNDRGFGGSQLETGQVTEKGLLMAYACGGPGKTQ